MSKLTPPVGRHDHIQGPTNAIVTLLEYGDFQCAHCGRAYPIIKEIQKLFSSKLRFAFRHFPLSNVHEYAFPAAIASEAAARQQMFWEMHDIIFERQAELSEQALLEFAIEIGLKLPVFKIDLLDPAMAEAVESDFESGVRSGVNGTPSLFINGEKYNGDVSLLSLAAAIEQRMPLAY